MYDSSSIVRVQVIEPGGSGLARVDQATMQPSCGVADPACAWQAECASWRSTGDSQRAIGHRVRHFIDLGYPVKAAATGGASVDRRAFSSKRACTNILRVRTVQHQTVPLHMSLIIRRGEMCAISAAFRRRPGSGQPRHPRSG